MSSETKRLIVGTAGHIDHGKSSLVLALTGMDPDRLEEEKRRGITIDLGFAFLELDGVRFGFVDVPGHERFVKNMLAGASGVDLVLLVIAANEGIKPQTQEHFEICRLLGVREGLIALTKSDLVDADTLALLQMEVEELVRGSFLEKSPVLNVSTRTGEGLERLRGALSKAATEIVQRSAARRFRMPIDRTFSVKGFGTVVTGTVASGGISAGEEVELLPGSTLLRVRGLQTGGVPVEKARAGQRLAVNLAGIEHGEVYRGMVIATPRVLRATRRADVQLELLRDALPLKHRAKVHFHSGTAETIAEVFLYDVAEMAAGQSAPVHLRFRDEIVLLRGDHFIVRQASPVRTIGGGSVLDPLARRPRRKDTGRPAFLQLLEKGSREEILRAMVERHTVELEGREVTARTGWLDAELKSATALLVEKRILRTTSSQPLLLMPEARFQQLGQKIHEQVTLFHKNNPLSAGIGIEVLRASAGRRIRPETFRAALDDLSRARRIVVEGELVKLPGGGVTMTAEESRAKDQIAAAFQKAGLAVPSATEVLAGLSIDARRSEKLLQMLLKEKVLVRVTPELFFHADALAKLRRLLAEYKNSRGDKISVPVFKDLAGISRKYAIPLLEHLDRERITRRAGDERVIL